MSDFKKLSSVIQKQFEDMQKTGMLYQVDVDPDILYTKYLDSFPGGTNEIFRERSEHDCSSCRQFIKNYGKLVTIVNDELVTVWDVECDEYPYNIVAGAMKEFVSKHRIENVYFSKFSKQGTEFTLELLEDSTTRRWNHLVGILNKKFVADNAAERMSQYRSEFQVFKRSLEELSLSAIEDVEDLINGNMLYRGEEHKALIKSFKKLKIKYNNYKKNDKDFFIWQNLNRGAVTRFRNTVIGTLVSDLSSGVNLENAVKMFESKVAPSNYKRPKSLITPKMIEDAMKTIRELNLEPALERRFARFSDVSVNDVLFVDNSVKSQMLGGLEESLMAEVKNTPAKVKNSVEITVEEFVNSVLPKANEIDVLIKNKHLGNFVSLTAPVHNEVENLFKWDNNFAWSYDGNITDSDIKTRVKKAGGNVDALMRCSLAWFNTDDLDIHVDLPNGTHVYYANKRNILDVDMNAGYNLTRTPVENTCWQEDNLKDGTYVFSVRNFRKRESVDVGFTLEFDFNGSIQMFHFDKPVGNGKTIRSLEVIIKNKNLVSVKTLNKDIKSGSASQEKWGVNTEQFVPVSSIVLSPNYWNENNVGNKHWFFLLKDCKNPNSVRGIYNEFLKPDLEKHRKVFEIIGDKTKCQPSDEQLSGVGFSSTKKEDLTIKVKSDKIQQVYDIKF